MPSAGRPFLDPTRRRTLRSWRLWGSLGLALLLAAVTDQLRLLWQIEHGWAMLAAFPLGHLVFGGSVALTQLSWRGGWQALVASLRFLYRPYGGGTLLFYLLLALAEELIFRAVPLALASDRWWLLLPLALLFSLVHVRPAGAGSRLLILLDFFLLGGLLGGLFLWLGELWPLVVIHWIRNAAVAKVFVRRHLLEQARTGPS